MTKIKQNISCAYLRFWKKFYVKIRLHFLGEVLTDTECVKDLDKQMEMIIFESIVTTFKPSIIFSGRCGCSVNWLEAKNQTTISKFSLPKSVKHSVLLFKKIKCIIFSFLSHCASKRIHQRFLTLGTREISRGTPDIFLY